MSSTRETPEQQAERELAHTEVLSPGVSRLLVVVFLGVIGIILPLQMVVEGQGEDGLQIIDLARTPLRGPELAAFERAHEDANVIASWVQPRLQLVLTRWGGAGNSSAVIGRQGWLFYEPGISHLAGPDPFAPHALARRRAMGEDHPDPRPALAALAEDCAAAGVRLVLLPVSDKAAIHPERLSRRLRGPIEDPAVAALAQWAAEHDITVLDPAPWLVEERQTSGQAFLAQDTHWTPAAMERVAAQVAAQIAPDLSDSPVQDWQRQREERSRVGDVVDLLRLPPGQGVFAPESVDLTVIHDASGAPWQPQAQAPILLLGDSFSNIFHEEDMGWGSAAGFAAHVAAASGRSVDQIAINGGGADAVRMELARRARPLAGTRVVVYQFSSRDLSHGSWPVIPLTSSDGPEPLVDDTAAQEAATVTLRGRVLIPSPAPSLTAPYEHARGALLLEVLAVSDEGAAGVPALGEEILVQTPLMESRRLRPAARWREGETLDLQLIRGVPARWQGRELLDDTYIFDDRPLWWHDPASPAP